MQFKAPIKLFYLFFLIIIVSGCVAVGNQTLEVEEKIKAAKVVAVNINSGGPWMREIERRLKKEGFNVLRAASVNEAIEVSGKN